MKREVHLRTTVKRLGEGSDQRVFNVMTNVTCSTCCPHIDCIAVYASKIL